MHYFFRRAMQADIRNSKRRTTVIICAVTAADYVAHDNRRNCGWAATAVDDGAHDVEPQQMHLPQPLPWPLPWPVPSPSTMPCLLPLPLRFSLHLPLSLLFSLPVPLPLPATAVVFLPLPG